MEEKKYPIYVFEIYWIQDGENWRECDNMLPEDRIWNSTSFERMFKEEKSVYEINLMLIEWWDKFIKRKGDKIKNPSTPVMRWGLKEYETWCLEWFSHFTFDEGQSDEEVLESFQRYVDRKVMQNLKKGKEPGSGLMGAEERWRWCGAGSDGKADSNVPPPCRCKFCKEQGVIRIAH